MATDLVLTLSILSAAGAAALAGFTAPLSCSWPSLDSSVLKRRLALLGDDLPGRGRRLIGMAALSLLLAGGGALAYAAEPAAPDQLPHEVVGVVGSGGQLGLQIKAAGDTAPRTLKVGDTYKDGWTLKAVTSSTATLSKGEEVREVGLNPAGAVAAAPDSGPPTTVSVAATVQAYAAQAAQAVTDAQAEADQARAALASASPDDRPAAQAAMASAQIKLITAQNNSARYRSLAAQGGNPAAAYQLGLIGALGDPIPAPGSPGPPGSQIALDQATTALRNAEIRLQQDPSLAARQALLDAMQVLQGAQNAAQAARTAIAATSPSLGLPPPLPPAAPLPIPPPVTAAPPSP